MPGYFLDSSVWVAFYFPAHPHCAAAEAFLEERTPRQPAWLARTVEISVLRLLSTEAVARANGLPALTNGQASQVLNNWRTNPRVRCLDTEPEGTRELWLRLADAPAPSPKLWMDAYLAALAIRAQIPLATFDVGFRRFTAAGLDLCLLGE